jgi:hypothetical protein
VLMKKQSTPHERYNLLCFISNAIYTSWKCNVECNSMVEVSKISIVDRKCKMQL